MPDFYGYAIVMSSLDHTVIKQLIYHNDSTQSLLRYKYYNKPWTDAGEFALKDDLADRTPLWIGSLELTTQYQNINISSAANYNQIIVVVKSSENNVTGDIVIDRYFFNVETNINRYINDPLIHTGVNIIPTLSSFRIRLIEESVGTWVLTQIVGKM